MKERKKKKNDSRLSKAQQVGAEQDKRREEQASSWRDNDDKRHKQAAGSPESCGLHQNWTVVQHPNNSRTNQKGPVGIKPSTEPSHSLILVLSTPWISC